MSDDVQVRNAVLHALHAVGIDRPHPYDVDCVLGSLMADGMEIIPSRPTEPPAPKGEKR